VLKNDIYCWRNITSSYCTNDAKRVRRVKVRKSISRESARQDLIFEPRERFVLAKEGRPEVSLIGDDDGRTRCRKEKNRRMRLEKRKAKREWKILKKKKRKRKNKTIKRWRKAASVYMYTKAVAALSLDIVRCWMLRTCLYTCARCVPVCGLRLPNPRSLYNLPARLPASLSARFRESKERLATFKGQCSRYSCVTSDRNPWKHVWEKIRHSNFMCQILCHLKSTRGFGAEEAVLQRSLFKLSRS